MPWSAADAARKTRKASTAKLRSLWAEVANSTLARTGNEALAIREANGVIRDQATREKRKKKST